MKRLLALLLVLCSLLTVLPVGALAANNEIHHLEPVKMINPVYQGILDESVLDELEYPGAPVMPRATTTYVSQEKAVKQLRDALKARQTEITVNFFTYDTVSSAADAVLDVAMSAHTGVPTEGDYLDRHVDKWSRSGSFYVDDDGSYLITLNFNITYLSSAAQEAAMDIAVEDLLDRLDLWDNTPYQKVKGIYDYICANVTYDNANLNNDSYMLKYTAYAALINRTSVCQGYASLFYRLALTLGVDCRYISGTGNGGRHGWNIVELDGLYYNLDATWDAGATSYDYFLRSEANFGDHTRNSDYLTDTFHSAFPTSAADYQYDAVKSNIAITKQPANAKVAAGKSASATVKALGEGLTYQWYVKDPGADKFVKSSNRTATYGCTVTAAKSGRQVYCVITDAYGNSLKTKTVKFTVKAGVAIAKQPVSVRVGSGKTAKVTVTATGDGLTYKWYFAEKGSSKFTYTKSFTGNTYSIKMNSSRAGRKVYCVITDSYGKSVKTNTVTLNMGNVVKITKQPTNAVVSKGKTASVKVTATGDGLTYKWCFANKGSSKFTYTSSFKTNTYSLTMNADRNGRKVYCVITDKYGNSVKTNTVTLYQGTPVKITKQPVAASNYAGKTAKVKVAATGDGLTYKWYFANKGSSKFTYTSSFKTNTYSLKMNADRNGRKVYCVITDKYGNSVKSDTVTIRCRTALAITTQPTDVSVESGATAAVTVKATGEGLTYKWYYAEPGSSKFTYTKSFTGNTYSVAMNDSRNGRKVYCVVTDKYGTSVTSNVATLSMKAAVSPIVGYWDLYAIVEADDNVIDARSAGYQLYVDTNGIALFAVGSDSLYYSWEYYGTGETYVFYTFTGINCADVTVLHDPTDDTFCMIVGEDYWFFERA